jgi:alcohol dehydrogenase class IV
MQFEFATAGRVSFGPGTLSQVPAAAAEMGRRALLVTGRRAEPAAALEAALNGAGVETARFLVPHEPEVALVQAGASRARAIEADLVIALGGGSALDGGKAIAALLRNTGELFDYLEVIGRGHALERPSAPFIAIPTTAGTGAEVTRNAVLASPEHRLKVSLRSPHMLPRLAVVDPQLTWSMPPAVTASSGLDALAQLLEPFVSTAANPLTDSLCREGLRRVARSLRRAWADGRDEAAREDMALASLFGGFALANARLGAVHGLAGPLGGMLSAPHGALCARLLPAVTEANIRALQARAAGSATLARYAEAAEILTGRTGASPAAGLAWLQELVEALEVPRLRALGLGEGQIAAAAAQAQQSSSMRGNPVPLAAEDLAAILRQSL